MQMQGQRPPPPEYGKMMNHQNQNMNYMMGPNMGGPNMGPNMGPGPPGPGPNMRFPTMNGPPRGMGPRQGFQSIPPSGPMMRQQTAPMMGSGPGDMQRMRFPPNHPMMTHGPGGHGPGGPMNGPNGPQKVPVSHPSPHNAGSPAGMWNNMGSGSPNPNNMQIQQQSIGSPRTPGDQNHGSPMMQQSMRSQTPGMTPVPNNQGMPGQPPRMGGGPQGNMGPINPRMPMMNPQHQNMMHQMHPGQQPGQQGPGQQCQQGQSSPARASPHMSHASPMGGNHPSPHMQTHMPSPNMMGGPMGQQQQQQQQPPQQQQPNTNTNPANKNNSSSNDDYNLDFLDSIPNDENNDNAHPNATNNAGGPSQSSSSQANSNADDLMSLLEET